MKAGINLLAWVWLFCERETGAWWVFKWRAVSTSWPHNNSAIQAALLPRAQVSPRSSGRRKCWSLSVFFNLTALYRSECCAAEEINKVARLLNEISSACGSWLCGFSLVFDRSEARSVKATHFSNSLISSHLRRRTLDHMLRLGLYSQVKPCTLARIRRTSARTLQNMLCFHNT